MAKARRGATTDRTSVKGARLLVVEARYYDDIADHLLTGAKRALREHGVTADFVTVPGALEIPAAIVIAQNAASEHGEPYDGAVALGCVIRGETSHYDIVAGESARALMDLSVAYAFPVGNAILTVDTDAQALERARPTRGNKGGTAVEAALSLLRLKRRVVKAKK